MVDSKENNKFKGAKGIIIIYNGVRDDSKDLPTKCWERGDPRFLFPLFLVSDPKGKTIQSVAPKI